MKFQHSFQVKAPLAEVAGFHSRAEGFSALTPPLMPLQMKEAPSELGSGDQMAFTMWFGPVPVHWRAFISQASPSGFYDHQLEGPFRYWIHHHDFVPVDETTTEIVDTVRAGLKWHPLWMVLGLSLWLGLPLLFAYRSWTTRRILESVADQ